MQDPPVAEGLVACLCAQWCRTCDSYRDTFAQAAREHPTLRFVWVDIEDEADALAPFDLDVENFPTVLVAQGDELRFLGTLTPHAATLARTIEAAQSSVQPGIEVDEGAALAAVLRRIGEAIG
jgi:thiol-disulfide isomerase/thioredoxin